MSLSATPQQADQILAYLIELKSCVEHMDKKLDGIVEMLTSVCDNIATIKKESRPDDEKLALITDKIDKIASKVSADKEEDLEVYRKIAEENIEQWNKLDTATQEFLTLAEYFYSKVQELKNPDFSVAILQFCRGLENELSIKLFMKYTNAMAQKTNDSVDVSEDLLNEKTAVFAKKIKRAQVGGVVKFTMGEMIWILSLLTGSNTLPASPLLQNLEKYLKAAMRNTQFLDRDNLKRLGEINTRFRNKCAHTDRIDANEARVCKETVPPEINLFVQSFN